MDGADAMLDVEDNDDSLNQLVAILGRLSNSKFLSDMLVKFGA